MSSPCHDYYFLQQISVNFYFPYILLFGLIFLSPNLQHCSAKTKMFSAFKGTNHQEVQGIIFHSCQNFIDKMSWAFYKTLISFSKLFPLVLAMNILDSLVFLKKREKIKALSSGTKCDQCALRKSLSGVIFHLGYSDGDCKLRSKS